MNIELYLFPFLKSFFVSIATILAIMWLHRKFLQFSGKIRKEPRHACKRNVSRFGGVAIIAAFLFAVMTDSNLFLSANLWGMIYAVAIVAIFGIWDDLMELDWRLQFFFQVAIALFVYVSGIRINFLPSPLGGKIVLGADQFGVVSFLIVVIWFIIFINSMNWLDGLDGLSGGITFISAMTIFALSMKPEVNQPPVGIISLALAGAVLGFTIFNFNPSKILAGTSGSFFMGFILAYLAIFAGEKIATAIMIMALPIADFFRVILARKIHRSSIFKPDEEHLHFKLRKVGWGEKKIAGFLYFYTLLIAVGTLLLRDVYKTVFFLLLLVVLIYFFIRIDSQKKLKADYEN